ncbi:hypothetical protein [Saccharothrix saharensis]|uniref:hypothetical protein n=1 Tax=Saccharothrix saharensis TaxID=571190 RepID=UPI001478E5E9|nr:hypothetical protein [Saccharothrix saharensis]
MSPLDAYGVPEEVLRLRAAAVPGSDRHILRGLPCAARPVAGVRQPRNEVPGS